MQQAIFEYNSSAQKIVQENILRLFDYKNRAPVLNSFMGTIWPDGVLKDLFMKKNQTPSEIQGTVEKTNPVLLKAQKVMMDYAKATGTVVCVHDQSCMPIREMFDYINTEKNACLFCIKHRACMEVKKLRDFTINPCSEMHINAINEAHRFGGSYTYMCRLGFMFWTSPLYAEGHFAGAILGSGLLGVDPAEGAEEMFQVSGGQVPRDQLEEFLAAYPRGEPEKINALANLLLICAEALSAGSDIYHEMLKRRAEQQNLITAEIQALKEKYPPPSPGPGYPLEKERMLLAALRSGDKENGRKLLNELLAILLFSNPDEFKYIQFRATELVVLLSRADANPVSTEKAMLETNNRYLKQIQEAQNIEALADVLHTIVDRVAGQIFSFMGVRHAAALRKAEHYIWENFTRKISLQEIADVSGLSAPYFSTIFKEEMGENLSSYLNRLRVEKAAAMLTETKQSLSEIAGSCGFEDQSWFSKIFKHYSGVSPGRYRGQGKTGLEISDSSFSARYRGLLKPGPHKDQGFDKPEHN